MTWEGGKDYVIDQGWTKQIDVAKIKHISNGVIIDSFDRNSVENQITDSDLDNKEYKNIVYAGSIRKVNNLGMLLDSAKIIQNQGIEDIRFLIYVAGNECKSLKNRCKEENITNVIFKGCVEKKADVIGFDLNEKKIELYKSGVDPQADAAMRNMSMVLIWTTLVRLEMLTVLFLQWHIMSSET